MGLFFILFLCQLITLEDLAEYWNEIFNLKYGQLTRMQYFACTWLSSFVIAILAMVILGNVGLSVGGTRGITYYLAYGFVYLIVTFVQISAFCRRMNDAGLSKWYTLVFLVPGIGNLLAILIALMPTGFGNQY